MYSCQDHFSLITYISYLTQKCISKPILIGENVSTFVTLNEVIEMAVKN